jgi:N-methylhydantoinase A
MFISRVIIPPTPGVFSARGMLTMDITHTFVRTFARSMVTLDIQELADIYEEMENLSLAMLKKEHIPEEAVRFVRSVDMCYEGQGHYVEVPVPKGALGENARGAIIDSFHTLHEIKFGHRMDGIPKTINVRMKAIGKIKEIPVKKNKESRKVPQAAFKAKRVVYSDGKLLKWTVLDRSVLLPGNTIKGPVIVEEPHHVTVVLPGQTIGVDKFRNLVITIGKEG